MFACKYGLNQLKNEIEPRIVDQFFHGGAPGTCCNYTTTATITSMDSKSAVAAATIITSAIDQLDAVTLRSLFRAVTTQAYTAMSTVEDHIWTPSCGCNHNGSSSSFAAPPSLIPTPATIMTRMRADGVQQQARLHRIRDREQREATHALATSARSSSGSSGSSHTTLACTTCGHAVAAPVAIRLRSQAIKRALGE